MTSQFELLSTPIAGLHVLQRKPLIDTRGYLQRLFDAEALTVCGWQQAIAQVNHTMTLRRGSVRGMHLQLAPHAEMKLISCLRGEVWDVALDLRRNSPTFLQWHAQLLSADNKCSYVIPAGVAHGFQTMCDEVEMLYCHSAQYAPACEMGVNPVDPRLAIAWPLAITEMSDKDRQWRMLGGDFKGVEV